LKWDYKKRDNSDQAHTDKKFRIHIKVFRVTSTTRPQEVRAGVQHSEKPRKPAFFETVVRCSIQLTNGRPQEPINSRSSNRRANDAGKKLRPL
jgi:hypothetical protein